MANRISFFYSAHAVLCIWIHSTYHSLLECKLAVTWDTHIHTHTQLPTLASNYPWSLNVSFLHQMPCNRRIASKLVISTLNWNAVVSLKLYIMNGSTEALKVRQFMRPAWDCDTGSIKWLNMLTSGSHRVNIRDYVITKFCISTVLRSLPPFMVCTYLTNSFNAVSKVKLSL
jgi:hypothetical protein